MENEKGGLSGGIIVVIVFFILVIAWMNLTEIQGCFK